METKDNENNLDWIFELKEKIPDFLSNLKGKKRKGFYHYSLSGDYLGERFKWGLGNRVFFLKIVYTLGLEKEFENEVNDAIKFILSFQRKDGSFYDPMIKHLSYLSSFVKSLPKIKIKSLNYEKTRRAETRQTISALSLYNKKPTFEFRDFPIDKKKIESYLSNLDWKFPWGAGSHFSHLLFFLQNSTLKNKNQLLDFAINWINSLQHKENGFWYNGNPSIQQKINGAMKIITGLKVTNKIKFNFYEKIIDNCLFTENIEQACDNFNIVYILKYCDYLANHKYRYHDIEEFMLKRFNIYKEYYYPDKYGFSFWKNKANRFYYGAIVSKGKNEPDIHGTVLFLWGISVIAQTLNINKELKFKEFIA